MVVTGVVVLLDSGISTQPSAIAGSWNTARINTPRQIVPTNIKAAPASNRVRRPNLPVSSTK